MQRNDFFLVSPKVLPPVFKGVILAKQLLADGTAANSSQAAKMAGISRSAFYKYRDFVFKESEINTNVVSLNAVLTDKAGVFSALTTALYKTDANIVTIHQGIPMDGTAAVSLTIRNDNPDLTTDKLIEMLKGVDGVLSVKAL
ncbi:MAG: ACT domain-containing protein [Clostridia bacterium]|nr:ACT domain-containing protein [Clostridia bacterium]